MYGFFPLASHIGAYGWPLELSLRPGTQHSAKETEDKLKRVIWMAQRIGPMLQGLIVHAATAASLPERVIRGIAEVYALH